MRRVTVMAAAAVWAALSLTPGPASAQQNDVTDPTRMGSSDGDRLSRMLLDHRDERRLSGFGLLVPSLASVAAGTVVAIAGRDDQLALFFGLGTVGWSAVNALLSLGLLDLGGGVRRSAREVAGASPEELREVWEGAIQDEARAETIFALNLGLDVFYMASGALLVALADQVSNEGEAQALRGYSIAQISQGALLFAFDLVSWVLAGGRGGELWRLGRGLTF